MERPGGTLRYADLDASTPAASTRDDHARGFDDDADGTRSIVMKSSGICAASSRDGSKSLARLQARMKARAARAQMRDALDLIREQDLLESIERREARTRQRRWYVLGRALDELMVTDVALRRRIISACNEVLVRDDERRLLGLCPLERARNE